jgi:hypothetical protein
MVNYLECEEASMGRVVTVEYVSLDGVMEDPARTS